MKRLTLALVATLALIGATAVSGCGASQVCPKLNNLYTGPNYKQLSEVFTRVAKQETSDDDRKLVTALAGQLHDISAANDGRLAPKAERLAIALEKAIDGTYDEAKANELDTARRDLRSDYIDACTYYGW